MMPIPKLGQGFIVFTFRKKLSFHFVNNREKTIIFEKIKLKNEEIFLYSLLVNLLILFLLVNLTPL